MIETFNEALTDLDLFPNYGVICRNSYFATRAALLSTESMKSRGMYDQTAMQLIKMTSEVRISMANFLFKLLLLLHIQ